MEVLQDENDEEGIIFLSFFAVCFKFKSYKREIASYSTAM